MPASSVEHDLLVIAQQKLKTLISFNNVNSKEGKYDIVKNTINYNTYSSPSSIVVSSHLGPQLIETGRPAIVENIKGEALTRGSTEIFLGFIPLMGRHLQPPYVADIRGGAVGEGNIKLTQYVIDVTAIVIDNSALDECPSIPPNSSNENDAALIMDMILNGCGCLHGNSFLRNIANMYYEDKLFQIRQQFEDSYTFNFGIKDGFRIE